MFKRLKLAVLLTGIVGSFSVTAALAQTNAKLAAQDRVALQEQIGIFTQAVNDGDLAAVLAFMPTDSQYSDARDQMTELFSTIPAGIQFGQLITDYQLLPDGSARVEVANLVNDVPTSDRFFIFINRDGSWLLTSTDMSTLDFKGAAPVGSGFAMGIVIFMVIVGVLCWLSVIFAALRYSYPNKTGWVLAILFFPVPAAFIFRWTVYPQIKKNLKAQSQ